MAAPKIGRSFFAGLPKTYPQPLAENKKFVKSSDLAKDFGHLKLFRARLDHVPIIKKSVGDMFRNEVTTKAAGSDGMPEEVLEGLSYNLCRYPLSYFVLNEQEEVVSLACSNVIYRDSRQDPCPPMSTDCSNSSDPFQAVMRLIDWSERRHLQRLGVDKLVHHELAYTPTTCRGQRISSTIYPFVFKDVIATSLRLGLKWNVGMVTCNANLGNMMKLHYRAVDRIPWELYVKMDGTPMEMPEEESPATLIEMDMEEMQRKGVFDHAG